MRDKSVGFRTVSLPSKLIDDIEIQKGYSKIEDSDSLVNQIANLPGKLSHYFLH